MKDLLYTENVALHCWNGRAGDQESISLPVNGSGALPLAL